MPRRHKADGGLERMPRRHKADGGQERMPRRHKADGGLESVARWDNADSWVLRAIANRPSSPLRPEGFCPQGAPWA
jgi:hypothetical protein